MNCEHVRNLFDAYLDGELSPSLETELGAHRVHCESCRHELALLEVAGHVVSADKQDSVGADFTERLLACIPEENRPARTLRFPRTWKGGAWLAAAAAITIACTITFSRPGRQVAGEKWVNDRAQESGGLPVAAEEKPLDQAVESLVRQAEATWSTRADSAEHLIRFGEHTLQQVLERLGTEGPRKQEAPNPERDASDDAEPGAPDDDLQDF